MDFQQIRDFVNPAVAQATGLQEVGNLSMPVPVAYVPVQLVIDGALSLTSENPVQNKVIAVAIQQLDGRITAIEGQFSEGVTEAVNNWLAAHPEATTTVQDGAITYAKLDSNLKEKADAVSSLSEDIDFIVNGEKAIDLDNETLYRRTIYSDGTWRIATGGNQSVSNIIPLTDLVKKITVECQSASTIIAFLKTYTGEETDGSQVDFAENYPARISIAANTVQTFSLYGDEKYLYILRKNSAGASTSPYSVTEFTEIKMVDIEKAVYLKYPFGEKYSGNDQEKILGQPNSIKTGKVINFSCDFSTFGTLHIKTQTAGGFVENDFAITDTSVTRTVDGSQREPVLHGLTIQNTIAVQIEMIVSGLKFSIISNGEIFSQTFDYANGLIVPAYSVADMAISNVEFAWTCKYFANGIWLFGDSYFSYGDNRWTYYLFENGYGENCMLDAYPGENSEKSIASLKSYLQLATPKIAVWCLGMNDGSDSDAPIRQWLINIQEFLRICNAYNITPILATIPTVPAINHDYKNEWVRNSGYQYIDFAKAVGASASGWFTGMLSNDGVHPTRAGAMALYHRAMIDCPQLFNRI